MKNETYLYAALVFFIIVAISMVLTNFYSDPINSRYSVCDPNEIKQRRAQKRGAITSIICSFIGLILFFFFINYANCTSATTVALIGMVLGNTIGYMLDSLATDEGFFILNNGSTSDTLKYAFGKLYNAAFSRYTLTIILDTFITTILFNVMLLHANEYGILKDNNYITTIMISSFLGIITFYAYTNQTRFLYAYPDRTTDPDTWIDPILIYLTTIIAGIIFAVTKSPIVDKNHHLIETGIDNQKIKIFLIIFSMFLMSSLSLYSYDKEKPLLQNEGAIEESMDSYMSGLSIFAVILFVCTIGTIMTSSSSNISSLMSMVTFGNFIILFILYWIMRSSWSPFMLDKQRYSEVCGLAA